jgi:hypothetical protein
MGLLLVIYTGASHATLTVTALTAVFYLAWLLTGNSGEGGSTDAPPS